MICSTINLLNLGLDTIRMMMPPSKLSFILALPLKDFVQSKTISQTSFCIPTRLTQKLFHVVVNNYDEVLRSPLDKYAPVTEQVITVSPPSVPWYTAEF